MRLIGGNDPEFVAAKTSNRGEWKTLDLKFAYQEQLDRGFSTHSTCFLPVKTLLSLFTLAKRHLKQRVTEKSIQSRLGGLLEAEQSEKSR